MQNYLPSWLDRFFQRHPAVMLGVLLLLALLAWLVIFAQSGQPMVVYEGF